MSYVLKKGKAVVLLSTTHDGKAVADNNVVIQYCNKRKAGAYTMDQIVCTTTTHVSGEHGGVWHNVLDVATLNAYTYFYTNTLITWVV